MRKISFWLFWIIFVFSVNLEAQNLQVDEDIILKPETTFRKTNATQTERHYRDVVVVVNTSSLVSDSVGQYFIQQRGIPPEHICYVNVSIAEQIDSLTFVNYANQVKTFLQALPTSDTINFLVTTKGCPLKTKRNSGSVWTDIMNNSGSCEGDLALLNGPYESYIGQRGRFSTPYFGKREVFSKNKFGFYITTRLDGYHFNDVKMMIDNSAPEAEDPPADSKFVFDRCPVMANYWSYGHWMLQEAHNIVSGRSLNSYLNNDSVYVRNENKVLGYASWGSNDAHDYIWPSDTTGDPYFQFANSAIAETYVSTSARSFKPGTKYGQSLVSDLIREGISGAKGYVFEPWSSSIAQPHILFERYVSDFNLGESYYMSSPYLSGQDLVIGDPKCLFKWPDLPVELTSFSGKFLKDKVALKWTTATETNNYGFDIEKSFDGEKFTKIGFVNGNGTTIQTHDYIFTDNGGKNSAHYRLKQIDTDGKFEYSPVIYISIPISFSLSQNYPNPFNSFTVIKMKLEEKTDVDFAIYDILGKRVFSQKLKGEIGENRIIFNGKNLASGIYFYEAKGNFGIIKKRMIILK